MAGRVETKLLCAAREVRIDKSASGGEKKSEPTPA